MVMIIFVSLTVFLSPIISLEARTLFEVPTTDKAPVIKNPFIPPQFKEELERDILEISEKRLNDIAHKYWLKKRAHSVTDAKLIFLKEEDESREVPKTLENRVKSASMKEFIRVCTHSIANAKLDNLIACILEGFKENNVKNPEKSVSMALQRFLQPRICNNFFLPLTFIQNYLKGTNRIYKSPTIEFEDVLDNFTTELLQKKIDLWETKKHKYKSLGNSFTDEVPNADVVTLSKTQLNDIFAGALNECNDNVVLKLVEECINHSICPNQDIVIQILYICAQNGKVNLIKDLKDLCEKQQVIFSLNFDFLLYEAHATWKRGNVIKAIEVFESLYVNNPFLRRHIKILIKKLVNNDSKNNSEAVLVHIIKFTENMVTKYKDYYFMTCIWEVCFMSEWFSDQQIALELLGKHKRLCEILVRKLPNILYSSLKQHKLEAVYRLLEILLDFEMREHYTLVVMALLDYQFLQGNLRSYCEIIKWCRHKSVNLPNVYSEKYFKLLFNKNEPKSHDARTDNKKNEYKFIF